MPCLPLPNEASEDSSTCESPIIVIEAESDNEGDEEGEEEDIEDDDDIKGDTKEGEKEVDIYFTAAACPIKCAIHFIH